MSRATLRKNDGFTLLEIMIVVSIIALLAVMAVPNFMRSRKRTQAVTILEDIRVIDSAVDQYAIENNKRLGFGPVAWTDVQYYLKTGTRLYASGGTDIIGNTFSLPTVDSPPRVNALSFGALSDVAPASFWSPYQ